MMEWSNRRSEADTEVRGGGLGVGGDLASALEETGKGRGENFR